jgi:Magnesium chelatase, subunit ChlI
MYQPSGEAGTHHHRVAGLTGARMTVVTTRPLRALHHTMSDVGLIGGGQVPMPGEVSLAHYGVVSLDELPEFRRHVLEVLRQPLRRVLQEYNLPHIVDLMTLVVLAMRRRRSGTGQP